MQKYTAKLILWKHNPNPQGLLPIYVKITIARKTSYLSTGRFIQPKYWDEKNERVKEGHPNAELFNAEITHRKGEIIQKLVTAQIKGQTVSASDIKKSSESKTNLHNIFEFIDQFTLQVKHKRKPGTLENYRKHTARLELFHGSRSLAFEDITPAYLGRYENHLRQTVGENYTHALFKTMRTFFNAAKKRGLITNYPFAVYENPVYSPPVKDYLTLTELANWEKFADSTNNAVLKQTAVYFLLGCYSGLRISDWFAFDRSKNIVGDELKLYAKKNGELVLMPISTPLARNLERMKAIALKIEEPTINEKLKIIAKSLGINKHLTSHTGRHTFAITICANQGVSSETCAELMGITVATCVANYYRVSKIKIVQETKNAWKNLE